MKKLTFIVALFFAACSISQEQKKAEQLVKLYLDSLNNQSNKYQIDQFENFHAIYTTIDDDPNYERYKNDSAKLDSIDAHFSPKIRGWIIYVVFKGTDDYGNFGEHTYQCAIDKNLSKCIVGLEVNHAGK